MRDRSGDGKEVVRIGPTNVVNLSVHRNTVERRKRHEMAKALMDAARLLATDKNVQGFIILAQKDGELHLVSNNGELDLEAFWLKAERMVRDSGASEMKETEEDEAT